MYSRVTVEQGSGDWSHTGGVGFHEHVSRHKEMLIPRLCNSARGKTIDSPNDRLTNSCLTRDRLTKRSTHQMRGVTRATFFGNVLQILGCVHKIFDYISFCSYCCIIVCKSAEAVLTLARQRLVDANKEVINSQAPYANCVFTPITSVRH